MSNEQEPKNAKPENPTTEPETEPAPGQEEQHVDPDQKALDDAVAKAWPRREGADDPEQPEAEEPPKGEPEQPPQADPQEPENPGESAPAEQAAGTPEERIAALEAELEAKKAELRKRDGTHGSELSKLRDQIAAMTKEQTDLHEKLNMKETVEAALKAEPDEELLKNVLGADYKDRYGEEFITGVTKLTAALTARNSRAEAEKIVTAKLEEIRRSEREDRMFDEIERETPGARKLNTEADASGLAAFLDGRLGETGVIRREVANAAYEAVLNGAAGEERERHMRTLRSLFKEFAGQGKPGAQGSEGNNKAAPGGAPGTRKPDPTRFAMPRTSGASPAPTSAGKLTTAQVDKSLERAAKDGTLREVGRELLERALAGQLE